MRSGALGISASLALLVVACLPTAVGRGPAAPLAVIPLSTVPGTHLRAIRVEVAGDSSDFLFDTGNGTTLIDQSIEAKIACVPQGNSVGFRMTGEKLSGPRCESVPIGVGGREINLRAGVVDMSALLGGSHPELHGVLSLAAFAGRTLTLDLANNRLIVESRASASERVARMHEVPARVATGVSGEDLDIFVGTRIRGSTAWLEWDSGHQASTFIAPHVAALLGLTDSTTRADVMLVWAGDTVVTPVQGHDIIYDGVLSAAYLERATWTVDLAAGRMWVGPFSDLPSIISVNSTSPTPVAGAQGIYDIHTTFGNVTQHSVLSVVNEHGALSGTIRGIGEENVLKLGDVTMHDDVLRYRLPLRQPVEIALHFDGLTGTADWSFGGRPAHTVAVKVR